MEFDKVGWKSRGGAGDHVGVAHLKITAQQWRLYGSSTPNLQKLARKILSLTCSAFGFECN
ncbi:hypothetical protein CR513_54964, partial [Mucuna pruriens]